MSIPDPSEWKRSRQGIVFIDPDRATIGRGGRGNMASLVLAGMTVYRMSGGPFSVRLVLIVLSSVACFFSFALAVSCIVGELRQPSPGLRRQILVWCLCPMVFGAYLVLVEGCWRGGAILSRTANTFTWQGLAYSAVCAAVGLVMMLSAYQLAFQPHSIGGALIPMDR